MPPQASCRLLNIGTSDKPGVPRAASLYNFRQDLGLDPRVFLCERRFN